MTDRTAVVAAARVAMGRVGVYAPASMASPSSIREQRDATQRFEQAGYGTVWVNEPVGGKDALVQLALLLSATERVVLGTGIANIWARAPQVAHGGAATLADAFAGRVVLGLGVGYPQQAELVGRAYGSPIALMRDYLDLMDGPTRPPAPDAPYARIIAANGPKMLTLAADHADGAMPAGRPPEFTAQARQSLGPDKLLVVGLSVPILTDADTEAVVEQVQAHRDAGADHIVLLPSLTSERPPDVDQLAALGPKLAALS